MRGVVCKKLNQLMDKIDNERSKLMYFLGVSELLAVKVLVLNLTFFIQGFNFYPLSEATLYNYMYLSFGGTRFLSIVQR